MEKEVYINQTSSFWPNSPVANDDMETYLGMVNGKPSRARELVLYRNGITSRYYALDKQGRVTHTSADMACRAIHGLESEAFSVEDSDLLAYGTASPEVIMPSQGVQVHGQLNCRRSMEVVSYQGSCCTSMQALKYAWLNIGSGVARNAICAASERMSAWMRAENFKAEGLNLELLQKRPIIAHEKDFLRWMLSDGAAALLLQDHKADSGLSLKVEWVELISYANIRETCMYIGGEKNKEGDLVGWTSFPQEEWLKQSLFSLKQDTRILGANIIELGGEFLAECVHKHHVAPEQVDWLLPHVSSMYFKDQISDKMKRIGWEIPQDRWFINLPHIGNVASVSALAMVDELYHSGQLQKGQHLLLMIPESARFTYAYAYLTVC